MVLPPREEDVPESSPATSPTSTATSSPSPAFAAQPTVAQKEPRNRTLHEQAVGLTVGISTGRKPIWLDSHGSVASPPRKKGRSPSRKDKGKKSSRHRLHAKTPPSADPSTIQNHGSSMSEESDADGD